jgi:L,D-peptidoglycan transpeptidase YkuD (ErfK/YbiS/YcfS/YnhG family)
MDLTVTRDGKSWRARFGPHLWRCAVGRGGVRPDKREGDGATPAGCWPLRRVLYRADRLDAPVVGCGLPAAEIGPDDGWCDAPADARYNRPVRLPYPGRHERLWRDDGIYDVIVVLGHNDKPPRPGAGSAVFLHVAHPDYGPTEGCVALALDDLLVLLREAGPESRACVEAGPS